MPSFTSFAAALALLAATVTAQEPDPNFDSINTPLKNAQVPAGQPFTITWSLLSATTPTGPVTITLIGGDSTIHLHPIATIGHVQNEDLKFVWNVDSGLGAEIVYGLNMTLDADNSHFQYSNSFTIVGGAASGSGSASGSASSTAASTGASSSATGSASSSTAVTSGSAKTSASSTTGGGDATTSTTAPTTTSPAPTHAANSTSNSTSPSSTASKTTPATKPTTTSGATSLSLSAVYTLAMALVASAALNWGL
ncbi:hypothetical protein Sste5346_007309 [Sporothrix stenoceras]|uniref:Yeast cell wall synthesis Kre9/Knh1-like N-terminal domain-containing protein n=1 Tax=Sporothrix stenoceras TaxID=5173 RepID=A0ABR3YV84_9PEZI